MSQQDPNSFPIDPFVTSGVELASRLNELNNAVLSGQSGTSRPSYAVQGYKWLDVTSSKNIQKFFTGTVDLSIIEYDTVANKAIINGGAGFTDKSRSVIHKFSDIADAVPLVADMVKGEFYLNNADKILFFLDNAGALASIGSVNTANVEAPSMSIGGVDVDVDAYGIIYGSNANGEYIKYPDGSLICSFRSGTLLTVNLAHGAIYYADAGTLVFPHAFISSPTMSYGAIFNAGIVWATSGSVVAGLTACSMRLVAGQNTSKAKAEYTAIGRWK